MGGLKSKICLNLDFDVNLLSSKIVLVLDSFKIQVSRFIFFPFSSSFHEFFSFSLLYLINTYSYFHFKKNQKRKKRFYEKKKNVLIFSKAKMKNENKDQVIFSFWNPEFNSNTNSQHYKYTRTCKNQNYFVFKWKNVSEIKL